MEGSQVQLPPQCARDDKLLAEWTFIRYLVVGAFMTYRFWSLSLRAEAEYRKGAVVEQGDLQTVFAGCHPFELHPNISTKLATAIWIPTKLFWAGCLFVQSEGVGLAVYFGVSALMDNCTIFLIHVSFFCKCVTSVAVYTMSLASFLPTAAFAKCFQHRCYEGKPWNPMRAERWYKSKLFFVAAIVLITLLFFILRLKVIETIRWDAIVNDLLNHLGAIKVPLAITVPPLIDLVQSFMLVIVARSQVHTSEAFLSRDSDMPSLISNRIIAVRSVGPREEQQSDTRATHSASL